MPIYQFINPSTLESVEVVQSMRDDHVYIDASGLEWERVWSIPNAQIDSQINPEDKNAYLRKTENKHLTMGDMMDQGKESISMTGVRSARARSIQATPRLVEKSTSTHQYPLFSEKFLFGFF
jgi:hypothetical protein